LERLQGKLVPRGPHAFAGLVDHYGTRRIEDSGRDQPSESLDGIRLRLEVVADAERAQPRPRLEELGLTGHISPESRSTKFQPIEPTVVDSVDVDVHEQERLT